MSAIETELVKSANGDTITLLMILFVLVVLGILGLLVNFVLKKLPEEMKEDREYLGNIIINCNKEYCSNLVNLISELKEIKITSIKNTDSTNGTIKEHNEQAKVILDVVKKIDINLDNRPCAKMK